jgi:transcriptional regulator with XRE-family HTH domain
MNMEVNTKIRHIRKLKGFTQNYLATELGVSQRAYSKIELNETKLNWKKMNQIASILNIGVWELLDTNIEDNPNENIAEKNVNLLQKLLNQYEDRIEALKNEVAQLKSQL